VNDEDAAAEVPKVFTLFQNTPNPFNPSTVIGFGLASDMPVHLAVYSASGQKVRKLLSGQMSAGKHSVIWDGRDDTGQTVSSGVYLYRLEADGRSETRKMMLMRQGEGAKAQRHKGTNGKTMCPNTDRCCPYSDISCLADLFSEIQLLVTQWILLLAQSLPLNDLAMVQKCACSLMVPGAPGCIR